MAAYLIAEIRVTGPVGYEEYRNRVSAVILFHGGKYVVRGGHVELLEGEDEAGRIVVLEFTSMAKLRTFYDSTDYSTLKDLRRRCSTSRIIAVEGV